MIHPALALLLASAAPAQPPRDLLAHVRSVHKLTCARYIKEHGALASVKRMYACKVCGTETNHAANDIEHHVKGFHSLTLEGYEQMFHSEEKKKLAAGEGIFFFSLRNMGRSFMHENSKGGRRKTQY